MYNMIILGPHAKMTSPKISSALVFGLVIVIMRASRLVMAIGTQFHQKLCSYCSQFQLPPYLANLLTRVSKSSEVLPDDFSEVIWEVSGTLRGHRSNIFTCPWSAMSEHSSEDSLRCPGVGVVYTEVVFLMFPIFLFVL